MSNSKPRNFQYVLAILGTFVFVVNLQVAGWFNNNGYLYIGQLLVGFDLGFLLSFSLLVILEMLRGNSYKIIETNPILKPLSYLCLSVIFVFSALGVWSTNYHTISYGYNTAFFIGSLICGFGLVPVISHHEK